MRRRVDSEDEEAEPLEVMEEAAALSLGATVGKSFSVRKMRPPARRQPKASLR